MNYFCLDCEASGPMPPLYNLLSIGISVVRPQGDHHVVGEEGFYIEIQPVFPGYDKQALEVCGLDPDRLKRDGVEPREAMERMTEWVRAHNKSRQRPVFVGHNAVFDWAYINYYYKHFGLENPFGYKGIDTKSMAMGRLQIAWADTHKDFLRERLGLPDQDPAQVHRADYDAWYQALILQRLLDLRD